MTLPDERYRALKFAKEFLEDLTSVQKTPRVSASIRGQARNVLRHFPTSYDLEEIAAACPDLLDPVPFSQKIKNVKPPQFTNRLVGPMSRV